MNTQTLTAPATDLATETPRQEVLNRLSGRAPSRWLGTCINCKKTRRITARRSYVRGTTGKIIDALIGEGFTVLVTPSHDGGCVAKCRCGARVKLRQITAITTGHTCGAKCRNSRGPVCECSCGGEHHGESYCGI